jgi:RNA polymerase sigma-70 factor (ECF subfamily)
VLDLYDRLFAVRNDPIVRLNPAVALSRAVSLDAALAELAALDGERLAQFPPYQAARADFLACAGRTEEARAAYKAILALEPQQAERLWLTRELCSPDEGKSRAYSPDVVKSSRSVSDFWDLEVCRS